MCCCVSSLLLCTCRALSKAADDGLLTSGFFWIPSLGGPTSMTMRQAVSHASRRSPSCYGEVFCAVAVCCVLAVLSVYMQSLTLP